VRTSSRNFAILLFDEVELWDVAGVMQVASLAGRHWNWRPFRLIPTAIEAGLVETRSQLRIEAKVALLDCPAPEILLIPGGYGARRAAQNEHITAWCAKVWPDVELTLAIGAGVSVLGAAGLLDDTEVAVSNETRQWLAPSLPKTRLEESERIVASRAGKLLTVASGTQAVDLGLAVVERFLGAKAASSLRVNLGQPPALTRLEIADPLKITLPPR
jgi:transcriptional regulator GlxA family with amidase domain